MYSEWMMKKVRQALGLEPDDKSMDDDINTMSRQEVFHLFLLWEGITGYTEKILSAIEDIYNIQFTD
jgi:hypothetical protein